MLRKRGMEPEKKKRCPFESCGKKLNLVDSTTICKCSLSFCSKHRHSEDHKCTFDYKAKGQRDLSNSLVKAIGQKVEVI